MKKRNADEAVSGDAEGVVKRTHSADAADYSPEVEVLDTCNMLGLSAGDALQVKWELVDAETGSCEAIWWDCELGEPTGTHRVGGDDAVPVLHNKCSGPETAALDNEGVIPD